MLHGEGPQQAAVQDDLSSVAVQAGPLGTAPEFNQLRQLLKSITLPSGGQF
jgi:hypothetical protein